MIRKHPIAWIAAGGVALLLFAPARPAGAQAPAGTPPSAAATAERTVTLHLRDTPMRTAVQMLFEGSGLQHAIEPTVPNVPVTLDLRDQPFTTALRTLLRLAPGATYRKEGDVFVIGLRQTAPPSVTFAEPSAPTEALASAEPGIAAEKIPLNYLHPAILAYVLGGTLIPNEVDLLYGGGGAGGYGGGYGGPTAGGAFGNVGGLGPTGNAGYGNGFSNGYPSGAYPGGGSPYLNFGNNTPGSGGGLYANPTDNSALILPRARRF